MSNLDGTWLTQTLQELEGGYSLSFSLGPTEHFSMSCPKRIVGGEWEKLERIASELESLGRMESAFDVRDVACTILVEGCIKRSPRINEELLEERMAIYFGWHSKYSFRGGMRDPDGIPLSPTDRMKADQLLMAAKYVSGLADKSELVALFERAELSSMEDESIKTKARRL